MKGFVTNLEQTTLDNNNFRQVLYTAKFSQLVLMKLLVGEDIGEEVHTLDQFLRIESGHGKAVLNGVDYNLEDGSCVVVPAGVKHNIINTSTTEPLKLYTVYSPPEHQDGIVRATKRAALDSEEHFDGTTTEV